MQLRGFSWPGSIISSHFLPRLLVLEPFYLTNSVVARLTVCIYIEILKYCMPYYEVANLVTVTKTNIIDEMPCAYGTLRVASGTIYILLMYPMNPFRRMVTVGHNATVFVCNWILTEQEETAKLQSQGAMQLDAWYWRQVQNNLPPGCL